jgi:hypothetical protein
MVYARVIHKKKEKSIEKQWTSVRDIKNNGYLDTRLKKKIAHVSLQKCSKVSTREICFKEHSRIRLATIYIHPRTCTS